MRAAEHVVSVSTSRILKSNDKVVNLLTMANSLSHPWNRRMDSIPGTNTQRGASFQTQHPGQGPLSLIKTEQA